MYYPYLRGKQYELITLREMAPQLGTKVIPILEPVKKDPSGLKKCITEIKKANLPLIFILNPKHGDFKNNNVPLIDILDQELSSYDHLQIGYIIDGNSELTDIINFLTQHNDKKIALIHYGYPDALVLASEMNKKNIKIETNVYIDGFCGKLYQRNLKNTSSSSVLVRDGFKKLKNADYPEDEIFSELHLTFQDEGVTGFGDFLAVGDDYSESGGPAYAIAIHTTYLREDQVMNIKHFVSDRVDSPVDPAGKFIEALDKLVEEMNSTGSLIKKTSALKEFEKLHADGHFPGLGYVKKLSMKHHLELLTIFLNN